MTKRSRPSDWSGRSTPRWQHVVADGEPVSSRRAADATEILSTLARHDVEYVVAGGYAVQVHGHVRTTHDVDILPNPGIRNMRRLAAALVELEAVAIDAGGAELAIDLSEP